MSAQLAAALYLLGAHFLCDFALQGDYMARAKKPRGALEWPWAFFGHGIIHGAAVTLITQSPWLGLAEVFFHCWIDAAKCEGFISYHVDQWLHIACKAVWLVLTLTLLTGCYLEHESIRDAGDDASYPVRTPNGDPCEGGVVVAYYGCTRPGDAYWRKYCEGPVIGCIAPGSPQSSTWTGR